MNLNTATIRVIMAEKQITNTELSKLSGISRSNLSTILNRGTCRVDNAGRIARALGIDLRLIVQT